MRRTKKLVALFVILCLCLSSLAAAAAAQNDTAKTKADTLNKFTVLKGNGSDYNLNGKLSRSEAAAFIVRLLGKESYVLANKTQYSNTGYKDIENDKWYASYIGFCSKEGIITGYNDATFKPQDYISEKAFLKLVLCALGLEYGKDFTWESVYSTAWASGIVLDEKYSYITEDNNEYRRADVVNVLYNALKKKHVKTKVTMLESLVESGAVKRSITVAEGFMKDEPVTAVENIAVNASNKIIVKLNENIKNIDSTDISIYEKKDSTKTLSAAIESQSGNSLVLTTGAQTPEAEYTLQIKDLEDMDGNIVSSIEKGFIGFGSVEVKSNFFKISKIEAVSKSVINVYFTHPVTLNAAVPTRFDIDQGSSNFVDGSFSTMSVTTLGGVDNALTIWLKDKFFQDGKEYTLKLSGDISSAYGVKLNGGSGESRKFYGNGGENKSFGIENVYAVDEQTVCIEFNMEVDAMTAEKNSNYSLKDTTTGNNRGSVLRAEVMKGNDNYYRTVYVRLPVATDVDHDYELTIKDIKDSFKESTLEETVVPFSGSDESDELEILDASPFNKTTVYVYFNKPLDPGEATDLSNYVLSGKKKVYFNASEDPYLVKIFLDSDSPMSDSSDYTLKVQTSIKDFLGRSPSSYLEYTFDGSGDDVYSPTMSRAGSIGENKVLVEFSSDVDTTATSASNYKLRYYDGNEKKQYVSARSVSFVNSVTAIITFKDMDSSEDYTIVANTLKDYSGEYTTSNDETSVN